MIKQKKYKHILLLSVTYFLTHWMLLFVSGRWWDDWCFYKQKQSALVSMALQMGRPSVIFVINFCKLFPESFYRIITFFVYYYYSLIFYKVLNKIFKISSELCLLIALISMVIPVNADRIMLCIFPYTLGMLFFALATSMLLDGLDNINFKVFQRFFILVLYFLSFTLNSNLFFYGVIVLLLMYKEKKVIILGYLDFILLPIIYFSLKSILFKPYGLYEGYNSLNLHILIKSIFKTILADFVIIIEIFKEIFNIRNNNSIVGILFLLLLMIPLMICLFGKKKIIVEINKYFQNKNHQNFNANLFLLFFSGFVLLSISLYPYVAVRNSYKIGIDRDAILTPFGISLLLISYSAICFNKIACKLIISVVIVLCIFNFNYKYLKYQYKYYNEISLQYLLKDNSSIKDINTIVYGYDENSNVKNDSFFLYEFYDLNANFQDAFDNQTRFVFMNSSIHHFYGPNAENSINRWIESQNYHMNDFDSSYRKLDALLLHSISFSIIDCVKLRYFELFNMSEFEHFIKKNSSMTLIYNTDNRFFSTLELLGTSNKYLQIIKFYNN